MKTVHAIFENGVFRPTEPVSLPEMCEVELEFRGTSESQQNDDHELRTQVSNEAESIEEKLIALAKQVPSADWQSLPSDLTDNLDHYLYGTPNEP